MASVDEKNRDLLTERLTNRREAVVNIIRWANENNQLTFIEKTVVGKMAHKQGCFSLKDTDKIKMYKSLPRPKVTAVVVVGY